MIKKKQIPLRIKTLVVLRDNGICQNCGKKGTVENGICGSKTAYTIERKYPHPNFPEEKITMEISHVVPEFLGGEIIAENLILMCRRCNRSLGPKIWQEKE